MYELELREDPEAIVDNPPAGVARYSYACCSWQFEVEDILVHITIGNASEHIYYYIQLSAHAIHLLLDTSYSSIQLRVAHGPGCEATSPANVNSTSP
jgi:hypothetical protein